MWVLHRGDGDGDGLARVVMRPVRRCRHFDGTGTGPCPERSRLLGDTGDFEEDVAGLVQAGGEVFGSAPRVGVDPVRMGHADRRPPCTLDLAWRRAGRNSEQGSSVGDLGCRRNRGPASAHCPGPPSGWQTAPMSTDVFGEMVALVEELQSSICAAIEELEPDSTFQPTRWERSGGGGGHTRVMQGGAVFEKAGVNTSVVYGAVPPGLAAELPGDGEAFRATGISLVLHPRSPMVPTTHANYRRIERGDRGFFGGGADLTPHYLHDEDAEHFHRVHAEACARHPAVADYPAWKRACDEYFYLPHRGEHRGVGGIFFDRLDGGSVGGDSAVLAFVADAGRAFVDAYLPIVRRRVHDAWGDDERRHQLLRRGRYVEFNLIYDRGTAFGLRSGGNVESILMSLPDPVRWVHDYEPEPGSWEARTLAVLQAPRDWL